MDGLKPEYQNWTQHSEYDSPNSNSTLQHRNVEDLISNSNVMFMLYPFLNSDSDVELTPINVVRELISKPKQGI